MEDVAIENKRLTELAKVMGASVKGAQGKRQRR